MRTASWVSLLQSQAFSGLVLAPSPQPPLNHRFITSFPPITFKQHLPLDEVCSYRQLPVKLCCLISKDEPESFVAEAEACLSVRGGLYPESCSSCGRWSPGLGQEPQLLWLCRQTELSH